MEKMETRKWEYFNVTHQPKKIVILLALPSTKARIIVFKFIIEYSSTLRDFGP
jgi:hypothetical protein